MFCHHKKSEVVHQKTTSLFYCFDQYSLIDFVHLIDTHIV